MIKQKVCVHRIALRKAVLVRRELQQVTQTGFINNYLLKHVFKLYWLVGKRLIEPQLVLRPRGFFLLTS